ncbi:M20 metallopeptidase family protein [Alteribacter natronophilus]|uniref:M20 metallopeptidase family protein n=1 Tax=Alteribacter natronophilus TaxID=2583810 RepID=UPI00110EB802|nr:amidohydrolase [Alteribacter natronophilus]TMW69883.1 amidohydrolase [Alteribacter natronophilus]
MALNIEQNCREKGSDFTGKLVEWRRYLHQNPELGLEEINTQKFVMEKLREMRVEHKPLTDTGVVAMIRGKEEGPVAAIRADMDALPVHDEKNVPYKSKVPGKGHMCGHDAHTAMLLGAAGLLKENPPEKGSVKLIFQPAEEGRFGAEKMIKAGALENPSVDGIVALHVHPGVPAGKATITDGAACAAADFFEVEIKGKGGHAAHPHQAVDPITAAAQVISGIQQITSRQIDPLLPAVITIGQIHGGTADNVIPNSVRFGGTVRTMDTGLRDEMESKIESVVKGITEAFGASYSLNYRYFFPSVVNDKRLLPVLEETAGEVLGEENLSYVKPSMGGEDFSFFTHRVPGLMFRLGVGNKEKGITAPLHHPEFDLDETALPLGSEMLARFADKFLKINLRGELT